jgi:3-isopropylmalate dehydrogenase
VLEELRGFDAILLGAVGPPIGSTAVPPGALERGLLLRLRFELDLYINLRPFVGVPGSVAAGAELVVVRENTEGPYAGEGGNLRPGTPWEVATQGSVNTRYGVERCISFSFDLAERRSGVAGDTVGTVSGGSPAAGASGAAGAAGAARRPHVTLVHKTNVLLYSGGLWQRAFDDVAARYPRVDTAYNHVDAACIYLVQDALRYDVIVTDNLFGDIITDLAGAVTGGIGLAASANLNPARTGPSLFEPVHGAAHDIAGTGRANPLAAIRSGALMLEHLGDEEPAERITKAVLELQDELARTENTQMSTAAIGDAIAGRI